MPRQDGFFIFYTKLYTFTKCNGGQASFEYFILFIIFTFICFAGMIDLNKTDGSSTNGFVKIRDYIHDISDTAVGKLLE